MDWHSTVAEMWHSCVVPVGTSDLQQENMWSTWAQTLYCQSWTSKCIYSCATIPDKCHVSNSNWAQSRDPLFIPPRPHCFFLNNQLSLPLILFFFFSCKSSTSARLFIKWHPLTSNNSLSWQLYFKSIICQTQGNWMDVGWAGWGFF